MNSVFKPNTSGQGVSFSEVVKSDGVYGPAGTTDPRIVVLAGVAFERDSVDTGNLTGQIDPNSVPAEARFVKLPGTLELTLVS